MVAELGARGSAGMGGAVGLHIVRKRAWVPEQAQAIIDRFNPRTELGRMIKGLAGVVSRDQLAELIEAISKTVVLTSALSLRHGEHFSIEPGSPFGFIRWHDLGVVSEKVITTAGVGFLVDAWQNIVELETMKYHGLGTGGTAEATGDTALVTELTTQYNPDSTRATGTLTEGAGANVFRSVATNTVDAAAAITEHGLFSQAATGGGVLWDRSLFSVVNLASADSLQSTYDMTASAGG